MEIVITASAREAAVIAAGAFERLLSGTDRPVIGLATGSSPLLTYHELIERCRDRRLSFARTRLFLLDEYVGLDPDHPQSCRSFVQRELIDHVDVPAGALVAPQCASADLATAGETYERRIVNAGGIDLQLLGIGGNGHIGFNEPPSSLVSRTRLKTLTAATRKDNARFFDNDLDTVPRHAITQGIGTILEARHVVLIATGEAKSGPIARAVEGPVTAMVPASALQLHPCTTVIIDEAAGGQLEHAGYYREAYRNNPLSNTSGRPRPLLRDPQPPRSPRSRAGSLCVTKRPSE